MYDSSYQLWRSEGLVTLRNKIGQMLVIGFDGSEITDNSLVAQWLRQDGLGGVLLFDKDLHTNTFDKNIKNQAQIKQLIEQLHYYDRQNTAHRDGYPLLTAIDFEGGAVDRLAKVPGCPATLNALELAALSDSDLDKALSKMAITLKNLGFNLNFAPVVDLMLNDQEGIIGRLKRSYSADPNMVVRVASKFVDVFNRYGIACAYKHFPGHGSAIGDTHEGFVDVTDTFQATELSPYQTLVKDKSKSVMIMTAHVVNRHLDSQGLPATLSKEILTGLLRDTMGFEGVIISDDLQMQAIANQYSLEDSLCLTINAGADMIIIGNQLGRNTATEVIDLIERLVLDKKIALASIDSAYKRVLHLKEQLNCTQCIDAE